MFSNEKELNPVEESNTDKQISLSEANNENGDQDVKLLIKEGLRESTIEALIASRVHAITNNYDEQLSNLLQQRESLRTVLNSYSLFINTKLMSLPSQDLSQVMLLDLWKQNNLTNVLLCIRAVSFAKTHFTPPSPDEQEFDNDKFFESTVKCFYHSRALLGIIISPQIIELHHPNFINEHADFEINRESGPTDSNSASSSEQSSSIKQSSFRPAASYKFVYKPTSYHQEYTVLLANKNEGAQFGGYFTLTDSTGSSQKYFVKAYYGYPAKGDFNSEKAFTSSMSFNCNSELFMDEPFDIPQYAPVDFKELFIYKVLEKLNVGPKSHFIINPYLKDGLFIATEDINDETSGFVEMGKMDPVLEVVINNILIEMRNGELGPSEYCSFNALAGLLEIDTINRVFGLLDANDGNFGYLERLVNGAIPKKRHVKKSHARNWLTSEHEFRIIDFFQPKTSDSYVVESIFESFLKGDSKYVDGHFMDFAIRRQIDEEDEDDIDLTKKHREEKIFFGKQVIQRLDSRFDNNGGLETMLNDAKKRILVFLNQKCTALPELTISKAIGLTDDYIEAQTKDLDNYIAGILQNYATLKNAIMRDGC